MKASTISRREQIRTMLADLKMPGALEAVRLNLIGNTRRRRRHRVRHPWLGCAIFIRHECAVFGRR